MASSLGGGLDLLWRHGCPTEGWVLPFFLWCLALVEQSLCGCYCVLGPALCWVRTGACRHLLWLCCLRTFDSGWPVWAPSAMGTMRRPGRRPAVCRCASGPRPTCLLLSPSEFAGLFSGLGFFVVGRMGRRLHCVCPVTQVHLLMLL